MQRRTEFSTRFQQAGLLSAIPFVLLVGPALGYYLGSALDGRWLLAPWGMLGGIVVGLIASARVTIQLIQHSRRLGGHD
jgi:hypothetical protein